MSVMRKIDNMNNSFLRVRVEAVDNEKILNSLLKNKIIIKSLVKENAFTISFDINVVDYKVLYDVVRRGHGKIQIINRRGTINLYLSLYHRKVLIGGVLVFFGLIYYLSSFIWRVQITTDKYLAPLEVRNILKGYKIDVGTKKNSIDVEDIEERLVDDIDEIMWVKVRIEGSRLTVKIVERQEPPEIRRVEYSGDVVARKNGVVNRVYSSAGTAVVKSGTVVSEGDLLVKGQEGKEGMEYSVKAKGRIYATTFYEEIKNVQRSIVVDERTGNTITAYGINVKNKTIYIKKPLNNFDNYDKIEEKWGIFIKEIYYEKKSVEKEIDRDTLIKEMSNRIILNLDRGAKVLDIKSTEEPKGDELEVRVLVTVEENIAEDQVLEENLEN